jgi:hypothetical protein
MLLNTSTIIDFINRTRDKVCERVLNSRLSDSLQLSGKSGSLYTHLEGSCARWSVFQGPLFSSTVEPQAQKSLAGTTHCYLLLLLL